MCLDSVDLGQRLPDRGFDRRRDAMSLLERELARQLEVQRHLDALADAQDGDVVDLAHRRDRERRGQSLLPESLVGRRLRLDVDDDVAARQGRLDGRLDRVGDGVRLRHSRSRRKPDDHVRKVTAPGLSQPEAS